MSVQLSPAMPRTSYSVGSADDQYKKYWVAILIGFVVTGAWLCLPIMETPVGSTHVDASKPAVDPNASQSLDSVDNPSGAPGLNLSMDGVKSRKSLSDQPVESMLYQAPAEAAAGAAAAGAPLGAASGGASGSLAQQLKDVGDKKSASSGWGEKAQRGFNAPHLGSSLSGFGGTSGGSGASAGVSAFGSSNAQIGFGTTKGLHEDGGADKAPAGGVAALRRVAAMSQQAAANRSNDGATSGGSRIFDGTKANAIGAPGGPAGAATYEALDAAPMNLKLNDPKLQNKELKEPAAVDVPSAAGGSDMGKQLAMMAATVIVGGVVGGMAGTMIMSMGTMLIQQQESQAAEKRSQEQIAKMKAKQGV